MRRTITALVLQATMLALPLVAQQKDIVATAKSAGQFATLLAAVDAAELTATLKSRGPFTVFAPTDEAFAKLPAGTVESLLKPENRAKLKAILLYHVVSGKVPASTARTLTSTRSVEGTVIRIRAEGSTLRINDAKVVMADVNASNGVIHVIDQVLLPPEAAPTSGRMRTGSSTTASAAREVLELAIDRGVPFFNDGQPEATRAIYEVAARGVLALGDQLPANARRALERGLRAAASESDEREQAWTLRRAIDEANRGLDDRMMTAASTRH